MKNKLLITGSCIIASGIILNASIVLAGNDKIAKCKGGEISISSQCLSKADYKLVKKQLKDKREANIETKGYDFDINDRTVLQDVLNYEIKSKGGMSFEGADKDKIKQELLKLLE